MGLCLGKSEKKNTNEQKSKKEVELQSKLQISKELTSVNNWNTNFISDQDYFYTYDAWYEKGHYSGELLFSKNIFIKLYQNYSQIQQTYMKNFQDIALEANPQPLTSAADKVMANNLMFKLRYLIRRGCHVGMIRTLIKNKFRVGWDHFKDKYEVMKTVVFEHSSSSDVRLVPTFSQHSLQQLLQVHCLNKAGESTLKRILWVVRENYPKLEYNPTIVQVAAICLIFFNEYETYLVLKTIIDDSAHKLDEKKQINQEIMKDLRWYFTLSSADYKKLKEFRLYLVIHRMDNTFFPQHSPLFSIDQIFTVLRIWTIYLNEGIRTLYKITFGIWMTIKDDVKKFETSDEIKEFLKSVKIDKTIEETDQLFVFEAIWDWIPSSFKISNPTMIYSTFKDGYSLQTLYQKSEQHNKKPMLLLVRTTRQTFGVFSETMIRIGNGDNYYGTEDIFLFTLEPKEIVFMPTGLNQQYIQSNRQQICFGTGPDGSGLLIKENLTGQSSASETFDNLPLHGDFKDKNFNIASIELYSLSI